MNSTKFVTDPIGVVRRMIGEAFDAVGEGSIHGLDHALRVEQHAMHAIREYGRARRLHADEQVAIRLAALLHDVDDGKIFPGNGDALPNARRMLRAVDFPLADTVLEMIRLVSFSRNGNTGAVLDLGDCHGSTALATRRPRWMYIPRDADRIEALGAIGVARCIGYGLQTHRPLLSRPLPLPSDAGSRELYGLSARWYITGRRSVSSIDYFVAGLIPRTVCATNLQYFKQLFEQRAELIRVVCLRACANPAIDVDDVLALLKSLRTHEGDEAYKLLCSEQ